MAGDIYLVGTAGSGLFSGHNNEITTTSDGISYTFQTASVGDLLYNDATDLVYKNLAGNTWTPIGKLTIHQGTDSYGTPLKIGSGDAQQVRLMYNGVNRIVLGGANGVTFSQLSGASAGIMGLSTAGVASNVQIGSGLSLIAGTLSATGSGGTVTSVAATVTNTGLTVAGSPITGSGTLRSEERRVGKECRL